MNWYCSDRLSAEFSNPCYNLHPLPIQLLHALDLYRNITILFALSDGQCHSKQFLTFVKFVIDQINVEKSNSRITSDFHIATKEYQYLRLR